MAIITTNGLVTYWNAAQSATTSVWQNIAPTTLGKYNLAMSGVTLGSDANGNYMNFAGNGYGLLSDLQFSGDLSIEMIFKPNKTNIDIFSDKGGMNGAYSSSGGYFYMFGGALTTSSAQDYLGNNVLFNLLFTVSNGTLNIYGNGVYQKSLTMTTWDFSTLKNWFVGNETSTPPSGYDYNGNIYAIRIYNRALSSAEVSNNYSLGTAVGLTETGGGSNKMKVYNGSSFADIKGVKAWNGSSFTDVKNVKAWDGSTWKTIL